MSTVTIYLCASTACLLTQAARPRGILSVFPNAVCQPTKIAFNKATTGQTDIYNYTFNGKIKRCADATSDLLGFLIGMGCCGRWGGGR